MKYKCRCGSVIFYMKKKKVKNKEWCHVGLYCDLCNKWIKWVNKKEQTELKNNKVIFDKDNCI